MYSETAEKDSIARMQQKILELERLNENYARIIQVMAHDLRNPLGGITSLAGLLLSEEQLSKEGQNMLELIKTTGIHSMEMLDELLKSGLAGPEAPMDMQITDVQSLLFDSVELLSYKAKEKGQRIIFKSGNIPIFINLNYEKIWRVFNNLIVNAIKFSHKDSKILVSVESREEDILIAVTDYGIGIPEQNKERVFEMFTTAKTSGTNGEPAFGLGLSISKRIIERHKGKLWFDSRLHSGTTFYISLPKQPEDLDSSKVKSS